MVVLLPRGGAKSTSAELANVSLGARKTRKYGLYVSETQEQADNHVQNIGALLESSTVERYYPQLAERRIGKYGTSRGWRRNRLSTAAGFTIDAVGLDTASRGIKIESDRPDIMTFDDIDSESDSREKIVKKMNTITRRLLPAGAPNMAVLAVQNLVHRDSIFSRLADGRADFLSDRRVVGPYPAIENIVIEKINGREMILGGNPIWGGQDLLRCQQMLDDMGKTAFLAEVQQEVGALDGRIFIMDWWKDRNRFKRNETDALAAGVIAPNAAQLVAPTVIAGWLVFDTAQKEEMHNDFSACGLFELLSDYRVRFTPLWNERLAFPQLVEQIVRTAERWRVSAKLRGILIEDKSSGTSAVQTIQQAGPQWMRKITIGFEPSGDKSYRARQGSLWCSRDCVDLPEVDGGLPALYEFEYQLEYFPAVDHDDLIDIFSMGLIYLENFIARGWQVRQRSIRAA